MLPSMRGSLGAGVLALGMLAASGAPNPNRTVRAPAPSWSRRRQRASFRAHRRELGACCVPGAGRGAPAPCRVHRERGRRDKRILDAIRRVPRHAFVPADVADLAYADQPLPIGSDQTISQPYIVAAMTEAVEPRPTSKCSRSEPAAATRRLFSRRCVKRSTASSTCPTLRRSATRIYVAWATDRSACISRLATGMPDGLRQRRRCDHRDGRPEEGSSATARSAGGGRSFGHSRGPENDVQYLERWTRLRQAAIRSLDRDRLMGVRFVPFLATPPPRTDRVILASPWRESR